MFFIRQASIFLLSLAGVLAANPPGNFTAAPASCTSVILSWTASAGNGGNAASQYLIFRDTTDNQIAAVSASTLSFTDLAAGSNSTHTYAIQTKDTKGAVSAFAWSATVGTSALCPPGTPGNLTASVASCSQVNLAWSAPSQTGAGLVGYRVYANNSFQAQVNALGYNLTGLAGNSAQVFDVSAVDSAGRESAKVRVLVATPACPVVVGPPGKASLGTCGSDNFITWPGSTGVKYQVEGSEDFGITWKPIDAPTTTLGVTNVRLASMVVYRVAWFTNTAEYRNNFALFSSDVTAPAAITSYTATELAGGQVRLSWSASADTQSGLKGYLLYRNNRFLTYTPNGTTAYTDGTPEAVSSTYDIVALDRAGNTTAKVRPGCTYSLSSSSWTAGACGEALNVYVTTSRSICAWTASSPCSWLTVTPGNLTGSGWVTLTAASNGTGTSRSCNVTIAGQTFTVTQAACGSICSYSLAPVNSSFGTAGGNGSFIVYTSAGCSRTATASATWITVTGGGSGSGNGTVSFSVAPNTGAARSGTITITGAGASQTYLINQDGVTPCSYSLTPTNVYFSSAAGSGSSIVNAGSGCSWTAASLDGWITITGGASGTGSGSVSYSVNANSSLTQDRVGRIRVVGGNTTLYLTINQDRNYAPVANAGVNSSGSVGANIPMDATASRDDDGRIVTYAWNYGDGSTGAGATAAHAYAAAGNYTVTVTVTDDLGAASSANKTVSVTGGGTPAGQIQLLRTSSGGSQWAQIAVLGVAVDGAGNIYSAGRYRGTTVDFGGISVGNSGGWDIFLTKHNASGVLQWVRRAGSASDDEGCGVALDTSGNPVLTGYYSGTVDFGGTSLTTVAPWYDPNAPDVFVVKYSTSGSLIWAKSFGGEAGEVGAGVAVDANNNIALAMRVLGSANMGGVTITSAGGFDVGVAKLDANGGTIWARCWGAGGTDLPRGVAVDSAGNVYVAGQFSDAASSYLVKFLSASGSVAFTKGAPGASAFSVAVHQSSGDVAVTGSSSGTVNFGGGNLTSAGPAVFLVMHNSSGTHAWSALYGGNSSLSTDYGMGVCFDPAGNVAITGQLLSSANFGGGWLFGNGNLNFFAASFTHAGAHRWSKRGSGNTYSIGYCAGSGASGQIVTGGFHRYTTDFGGLSAVAPTGNDDGFVAQYAP